ncbi:MAG: NADH-quinone oxidoreductase subunit J [Actinobacteria bacterium]|nr:NADH-quinone oxidoreductase subunit J [Actinomycetota bacterium]
MMVAFWIAGGVAVAATGMVITRKNAMHALLYLVVSFLALAVVFYVLGAPLIAALEVIIYAGAIMVLFLFALMLLGLSTRHERQERAWMRPQGWVLPGLLTAVLLAELIYVMASGGPGAAPGAAPGPLEVKDVGMSLFGPYLLGVELASILLLAGLVAAHRLTREDPEDELQ